MSVRRAVAGSVCALCIALAPAARAATPPTKAPAPPAAQSQTIKAENVLIQGKLYSPSALFILTRPQESFGRDVVLPHYLNTTPATGLAASRLQPAVLQAHSTKPTAKER